LCQHQLRLATQERQDHPDALLTERAKHLMYGRPMPTATAPSASAVKTFVPRRIPPSRITGIFPCAPGSPSGSEVVPCTRLTHAHVAVPVECTLEANPVDDQ